MAGIEEVADHVLFERGVGVWETARREREREVVGVKLPARVEASLAQYIILTYISSFS